MTHSPIPIHEINAINKRCYNARADLWDRMPFGGVLPEKILQLRIPEAGMKALDIGSGTGMLAEWLARHGYDILCLDPSDEMVRRCQAKQLKTIQTTIQNFSTNEKFGLILAVLSLIHVPKADVPALFQRMDSWLNHEGLFVLGLIEGKGEGIGERDSKYPRYFSYYTREEILKTVPTHWSCVYENRVSGPVSYLIFVFRK